MAQKGSAAAMRWNWGLASSYQKSCSSATPRLKLARTEGAQEVGNATVPRLSLSVDGEPAGAADCTVPQSNASAASAGPSQRFFSFISAPRLATYRRNHTS